MFYSEGLELKETGLSHLLIVWQVINYGRLLRSLSFSSFVNESDDKSLLQSCCKVYYIC